MLRTCGCRPIWRVRLEGLAGDGTWGVSQGWRQVLTTCRNGAPIRQDQGAHRGGGGKEGRRSGVEVTFETLWKW